MNGPLSRRRRRRPSASPDTAWRSLRGDMTDGDITDGNTTAGERDDEVGPVREHDPRQEEPMASEDDDHTRPISAADLRTPAQRLEDERARERVEAAEGPADEGAATEGTESPASAYNDLDQRPAADHPDKASSPKQLKKPGWTFAIKNAFREFLADDCTDLAAGLTYYSVLAIFPAGIALLGVLGLLGQGGDALDPVIQVVRRLVTDPDTEASIIGAIENVANADSRGTGIALIAGLLGALFSASGYVGAFSRAMNRIYEVPEGRPIWKLRPAMLLITAISIVLLALGLVILVVSGPVAEAIGGVFGLGETTLLVWNIAKWPVLGLIVVLIVALLYWGTPNVRQPSFRWISVGAFLAIVVWLLASALFGLYIAFFGNYDRTYGAVAGAIVFLLWVWITNLALLLGAELDSELERSRELQAGIAAEEQLQLPLRDDREVKKQAKGKEQIVATARAMRENASR